jgi:hypothetical protein
MHIKTSEGSYNVASAGVGGAGLGLGIAGTALALLNGNGLNLFGMNNNCQKQAQCYDTRLISALESEIAMLKAEKYTDSVGTGVYAELNKKYTELAQFIASLDKQNAVFEAVNSERITCLSNRVSAIEALTKLVVPNNSVCPGWGNVTITPSTTTTP